MAGECPVAQGHGVQLGRAVATASQRGHSTEHTQVPGTGPAAPGVSLVFCGGFSRREWELRQEATSA